MNAFPAAIVPAAAIPVARPRALPSVTTLPPDVTQSLIRLGLLADGAPVEAERLSGGVSSDIWRLDTGVRVFCVKRAMPKLAVKEDWYAPVERNRYERLWYAIAGERVPGVAPRVLA